MKHRTLFISALIALFPEIGRAGTVAIGLLSFDVFIPSSVTPPVPGINALNLLNATGPTFGGLLGSPFANELLTFRDSSIVVTLGSGPRRVFELGDVKPGQLTDLAGNPPVQIPATTDIASAIFTGTLDPSIFQTSMGSTFDPSELITATLTPSSGMFLQAGVDSVILYAEPVPEPSSFCLLAISLSALCAMSLLKTQTKPS